MLDVRPNITMDDGADMVSVLHKERVDQIAGDHRRHGGDHDRRDPPAGDGRPTSALKYPIVSVNDADTKHLFDNRFGTGQSTIDAIMRATNRLLAGRTIVVCRLRDVRARGRRHGPGGWART